MDKRLVLFAIGNILLVLAVTLLAPLAVCLTDPPEVRTGEMQAFGITVAATAIVGLGLRMAFRKRRGEMQSLEGFAVVSLGWITVAFFGSLPFLISGAIPSFADALFETTSGFTTTGATILSDIEALPQGLLFWRSFTHWLGGMGIVLLSVAILPALGAGGSQLFKAEVPGISGEKLTPRIAETAKVLWQVYLLLTVLEIGLLFAGGMSLFDSACHTFGTMATAGFSTKNASIGHYQSAYVEWVIIAFMFLAGCNFVLHYHLLRRNFGKVADNRELRWFIGILVGVSVLLTVFLVLSPPSEFRDGARPDGLETFGETLRTSVFQAVAITTTTGFGTADFDAWPDFCRFLLVVMMFVGGCSGSTTGSIKVSRILILLKYPVREIRRLARPRAVFRIRIDDEAVDRSLVDNVIGFCLLFFLTFVAGTLLVVACENIFEPPGKQRIDLVTASTSVIAAIGNIGPGLNRVGPAENYGWFSDASKYVLSFLMILGRLEIFCVLVLLSPRVWRR